MARPLRAAVAGLALLVAGCTGASPAPASTPVSSATTTASAAAEAADHVYRMWVINVGSTASGADLRRFDTTLATAETVASVRQQVTTLDPKFDASIHFFADVRGTSATPVDGSHLTLTVCSATTVQRWTANGPEPLPGETSVRPDKGTFQQTSVPMTSSDGTTWKVAAFDLLATGPAC